MSIYHTTPSRCTTASQRIHQQVEDFLAAGGCIDEIPTGQSAHNLQVKAASGEGTRVSWQDAGNHWTSTKSKAASIRQRQVKAEEQRARKRRARALSDRARKRRNALMPQVRAMAAEGLSNRKIGEALGVAHRTIGSWLRLDGGDDAG